MSPTELPGFDWQCSTRCWATANSECRQLLDSVIHHLSGSVPIWLILRISGILDANNTNLYITKRPQKQQQTCEIAKLVSLSSPPNEVDNILLTLVESRWRWAVSAIDSHSSIQSHPDIRLRRQVSSCRWSMYDEDTCHFYVYIYISKYIHKIDGTVQVFLDVIATQKGPWSWAIVSPPDPSGRHCIAWGTGLIRKLRR